MVLVVKKNNKKNLLPSGFATSRRSKSSRNCCANSSSTSSRNVRLCYTLLILVACAIIFLLYFQTVITFLLAQQEATTADNNGNNIRSNGKVHVTTRNTASIPQKFVTIIMPSVVNPQGRTKRLTAITDTWGSKQLVISRKASKTNLLCRNKVGADPNRTVGFSNTF